MKILRLVLLGLVWGGVVASAQDARVDYSDETLRFSYEATMASEVSVSIIEEVPYGEEMPVWAANPEYVEYGFADYAGLTEENAFFHTPRIMVYNTGNFEAFTDRNPDFPYGYGVELENLQALLAQDEIDWTPYLVVDTNSTREVILPLIPLFNAAQVFRAQPKVLEFEGGKGIRFLSYYSQAVNPIIDKEIFYTFQGVSDSGTIYIAAIFPLQTGLFPAEVNLSETDYEAFAENYNSFLAESASALNEQASEAFNPTLESLDALIESLQVAGN